jgi:hypothetical protein
MFIMMKNKHSMRNTMTFSIDSINQSLLIQEVVMTNNLNAKQSFMVNSLNMKIRDIFVT